MQSQLEHLNITVPQPEATAEMLCTLFGWHIRWQGPAKDGGHSVHVGGDDSYLALYAPKVPLQRAESSYGRINGLNHLGVVVDDLDAVEARVKDLGMVPHSHGDYAPGRRFYFHDDNGLEIEVVQY